LHLWWWVTNFPAALFISRSEKHTASQSICRMLYILASAKQTLFTMSFIHWQPTQNCRSPFSITMKPQWLSDSQLPLVSYPVTVCKMYCWLGFFSGSPGEMSGLKIVTDAQCQLSHGMVGPLSSHLAIC
jgi:hypothetical protein